MASNKHKRHGLTKSPLYNTWRGMLQRCFNAKSDNFGYYGGRGITITPAWLEFYTFYKWAIQAGWRPGLTIERINNNYGYCPGNCCFADHVAQSNNRRDNIMLQHEGEHDTLANWARRTGKNYKTLYGRLRRGWPVAKALSM